MQNKPTTRRQFIADALKLAGATAITGMLPESIARAQAIPAATVTGTIQDVKHVVILMQENRSFDHYLGTLGGARGFGDPRPVVISSGYPVWRQPWMLSYVFPFNPSPPFGTANGDTYYGDLDHSWSGTHSAWNNGRYDNWAGAKTSGTMYYFTQNDIPFYYALASAFTVCDAYHCSMLGPTDPNRLYQDRVLRQRHRLFAVHDQHDDGHRLDHDAGAPEHGGRDVEVLRDKGNGRMPVMATANTTARKRSLVERQLR